MLIISWRNSSWNFKDFFSKVPSQKCFFFWALLILKEHWSLHFSERTFSSSGKEHSCNNFFMQCLMGCVFHLMLEVVIEKVAFTFVGLSKRQRFTANEILLLRLWSPFAIEFVKLGELFPNVWLGFQATSKNGKKPTYLWYHVERDFLYGHSGQGRVNADPDWWNWAKSERMFSVN